jgi:hypothetical protein
MKQTKANAAINSMVKDILPQSFTVENTEKRHVGAVCLAFCSVTANAKVTNAIIEPIMNKNRITPETECAFDCQPHG